MSTRPQKTKIIHALGPEFLVSIPNKYSLHKHFILADKLNPTSTNNRTERLFWSTNFHYENIGEPASAHQPLLISEELSYFLPKMLPMNDTRILGSTVPFLFCSGLASSG